MINGRQRRAVHQVAIAHGWEAMSFTDLGLLLWALFHYYVSRVGER